MGNDRTTHTFWNLVKSCDVIIPKLQRDYAQGKKNDSFIEQIRNSLIEELYGAVNGGEPIVLNFIYGEKGNDKFIPIDGQQRLTTLFLFHWYVFSRSSFTPGLEIIKHFSYETRDTSKRFCERICGVDLDFTVKELSDQIKEYYWFTGNFEMDPTIQSMLVVIDAIHNMFYGIENIERVKDALIADDCPISFLWLEMPNFQQTSDLYIKMNARGRLLSDFEIFKAKLQNSDILTKILGESSEREKILFISKYNNEYAEFFYRIFQEEYDNALMDFIKEMIRDSYLSYVSSCGVPQKTYRSDYGTIKSMNGSVLFRFIEKGGTGYEQCKNPEETFISALKKVDKLLDEFNSMDEPLNFENTLNKDYYDEKELLIKSHNKENLEEDVVRYSLYMFLYRFGIPTTYEEKNAYSMWKRVVYNIANNSMFEGRREDICEAFAFLQGTIDRIESCDEASVLYTLSTVDLKSCTAAIRYQMSEEIVKAKLIQEAYWKKEILDAESYFRDGEIGFLLDCSKNDKGSYDLELFHKYFVSFSSIFDSDKKLKQEIDAGLFEKALLCMNDPTDNGTSYLLIQANSKTSWGFVGRNFEQLLRNNTSTDKKSIVRELIDRIMVTNTNINQELDSIVQNVDESSFDTKERWKLPFIQNDLFDVYMGEYKFKNCINLENGNSEILMIAGTTVRSKSMELNTFLLFKELEKKQVPAKIYLSATGVMKDVDEFPTRYIEVGDINIGYDGINKQKPYICRRFDHKELLSWDEAVSKALVYKTN